MIRRGLDFLIDETLLDGLIFLIDWLSELLGTTLNLLIVHHWFWNNCLFHSGLLVLISLNRRSIVLICVQRLELVCNLISLNLRINRLSFNTFLGTDQLLFLILLNLNKLLLLLYLSLKFADALLLILDLNHLVIV